MKRLPHRQRQLLTALNAEQAVADPASEVITGTIFTELNAEGGVPEVIVILPAPGEDGLVTGLDGRRWRVPDIAVLAASANNQPRPLFVDYGHESEGEASFHQKAKATAAAWPTEFRVENGAIVANANWTQTGRDAVERKDYRFLSPALRIDRSTNTVVGLGRPGLTNLPNFPQTALNSGADIDTDEDDPMKLSLAILTALNLGADATESDAVAAITALKGEADTALNAAAELKDPTKWRPASDVEHLETQLNAANEQLAERRTKDVEAEIDGAIKEGKIAPASRDHYLALCASDEGLAQVREIIKSTGKVAPQGDKGTGAAADDATELNAAELEYCEQMGIKPDDFKATKASMA